MQNKNLFYKTKTVTMNGKMRAQTYHYEGLITINPGSLK